MVGKETLCEWLHHLNRVLKSVSDARARDKHPCPDIQINLSTFTVNHLQINRSGICVPSVLHSKSLPLKLALRSGKVFFTGT